MEPLRIGILGASRIAPPAIVEPARHGRHRLIAVAARDADRAADFANTHGIERSYGSYEELLADPEIELVYNGLVNGWHAHYNGEALRAGKHVLCEKPFASNAAEAAEVAQIAGEQGRKALEAMHYVHHPVVGRLRELVTSGALGDVTGVEVVFEVQGPPDGDPRYSFELAGGATMDLGCYVLHALRTFGHWTSGEPTFTSVEAGELAPGVDQWVRAELSYPDGLPARARWDIKYGGPSRVTWTVTGSRGSVTLPYFAASHRDNRLLITTPDGERTETAGNSTTFDYQLRNVARTLREGVPFAVDADESVRTMDLIDECYRRAGLPLRPTADPHQAAS